MGKQYLGGGGGGGGGDCGTSTGRACSSGGLGSSSSIEKPAKFIRH